MTPLLIFCLSVANLILASPAASGHCSSNNNHLDPASKKFVSDCSEQTFCSGTDIANSTCVPRQCRRDEFPFGFSLGEALPPLCPDGTFCPDEGSGCRPLVPPGNPCELNRDEQCGPPPSWKYLASTQNFNGSICLRSICMYANVTLGDRCITDNTTYLDIGPNGQQIANTVTRGNCQSQLYCNPTELLCEHTLPLNSPCQVDPECTSFNCATGRCANPPETPLRIPAWQCALTSTFIVVVMVMIFGFLTLTHKQHRLDRSRELREYYYQQIGLRRSLIALHVAAVDRYTGEKNVG
ncbi:hypothetical protein B0H16DRAFT_1308604 [Mycena metata]|uniref:Uncharacterized protein n=1 Tax=Mycena metata TaxID=1033252 RepID=A0AAD7JP32_9AGAR|nr:hypothetical protein B0H16DRAFT_1315692 [Mycena metata]KAJ7767177.1 hypothetical protein B0H16DRAFT_1308604 [Mycena metata]